MTTKTKPLPSTFYRIEIRRRGKLIKWFDFPEFRQFITVANSMYDHAGAPPDSVAILIARNPLAVVTVMDTIPVIERVAVLGIKEINREIKEWEQ